MTIIKPIQDDTTSKIKHVMMYKLGLETSQLLDQASFTDDLGIDSLDVLELQIELEKVFCITIPTETAEKLTTVGSVITYVNSTMLHKPG